MVPSLQYVQTFFWVHQHQYPEAGYVSSDQLLYLKIVTDIDDGSFMR